MKKIILVNGLIAGVIVSSLMLISMNYFSHCEGNFDYNTSMAIGYASMLLAFSLVYVGIRNYRNNYNGGVISFGKAFKIGLLMVLIASTLYVLSWLMYYYFFNPSFGERMAASMMADLKANGASQAAIDAKAKEMAGFEKMLSNPLFNGLIAYSEILPVGIVVSLICALILKKKAVRVAA